MAFEKKYCQQIKKRQDYRDPISGEHVRRRQGECHSSTRHHLICKLTGQVLDGVFLHKDTHRRLHETADHISQNEKATPREIHELTHTAMQLTLLSMAGDYLDYLSTKEHRGAKYKKRKIDGFRAYLQRFQLDYDFDQLHENAISSVNGSSGEYFDSETHYLDSDGNARTIPLVKAGD